MARHFPFRGLGALALAGSLASGLSAAESASAQRKLLNILDANSLLSIGGWQVDSLKADAAKDVEAKIGSSVTTIRGVSRRPGGKVDVSAFSGSLPGCEKISIWMSPVENVDAFGIQVRDAKGEVLLQTVPVDWNGWKKVEISPTVGEMKQAYPQQDHDGKVDLPITSVNIIWFTKSAGPTAVHVDELSAVVEAGGDGLSFATAASRVIEPDQPLNIRLIAENHNAAEQQITLRYSLQANPEYVEPVIPDPVLGFDHALGAKSTVWVNGEEKEGDSKLCDGDEFTAFETPWGSGWKEVVATIDLGQSRNITAIQWRSGDANWIEKVDVSVSSDGQTFTPVQGLQGFVMKKKWGINSMPWPGPVEGRYVRLRFHNDGQESNVIRLPVSLMIYDGVENDTVEMPQVGEQLASGTISGSVPARDFAEIAGDAGITLGPGAYLLAQEIEAAGRKQVRVEHLLVLPNDEVDQNRTRRFGINGSNIEEWMAENLKRCGFGWMRYENAKWQMYMPSKDRVAFDGSVTPWRIPYDRLLTTYQANGLKVLPYIFQPPEWATSAPPDVKRNRHGYPPKDPADYEDAIFQFVARFGRNQVDPSLLKSDDKKSGLGLIDAVELWNEPNLNDPGWGPFVGPLTQYFDVLRAGAQGARRADPNLPITSCGFAGIGLETVGLLHEHKYADGKTPLDFVDVINVHFYSGRSEPETAGWDPNVERSGPSMGGTTYPEQVADLVAWRDRLKPEAEIWLTETGNDVGGPIGRTERHQAAKLPRTIMIALAEGMEKVFIYREAGSNPTQHGGAGLLRNDHSIRPAWVTVATMIRQLQGFDGRALRIPTDDSEVWIYLWQDDQRKVITAWTISETQTRPLGIEFGKGEVCDAFGQKKQIGSTSDLQIGYFPRYITITEPSPEFARIVSDAQAKQQQRKAEYERLSQVPMKLFDFGTREHVGMLKGFGAPRRFQVVTKDDLWDGQSSFGFAQAPAGEDDRRWIANSLERDGCRVAANNPFKFSLEPGSYTLRLRVTAINEMQPQTITVKSAGGTQQVEVSRENPVAELTIAGGNEPVEVSADRWAIFRWISAIPVDVARSRQ